ncbi:hypothetical protein [Pseudomonas asplenii]|uniref:hypothetical protein n=1 Tax=Pseudomonas asplenii TaxID=53407 RepID=UPI0003673392|nr:hypothetical protein [Pseudomonas fuscovaginae]
MTLDIKSNMFARAGITYESNKNAISDFKRTKELGNERIKISEKIEYISNSMQRIETRKKLLAENIDFKEQVDKQILDLSKKATHRCIKHGFRSRPITSAYPTYDEATKTFRLEHKKGFVIKALEIYHDKLKGKNYLTNESRWSRNFLGAGQRIALHNENMGADITSTKRKVTLTDLRQAMNVGFANENIGNLKENLEVYKKQLSDVDNKIEKIAESAKKAEEKMAAIEGLLANKEFTNYLSDRGSRPKNLPEAIKKTSLDELKVLYRLQQESAKGTLGQE